MKYENYKIEVKKLKLVRLLLKRQKLLFSFRNVKEHNFVYF